MLVRHHRVGFATATVHVLLSIGLVTSQVTDYTTANVGDIICYEGFVMDNFCIERGTLLDEPSTTTLLNPERHSVHCLIDVRPCYTSNYELLAAPTGGDTLYSRAFQLSDDGKAGIIALAAAVSAVNPSDSPFPCTECTGTMGDLGRGFRAMVHGIVTEARQGETPATIHVVDAVATHDQQGSAFCTGSFPTEQNLEFGDPMEIPSNVAPSEPPTTEDPTPSPTKEPTERPTDAPTTEAPVVTPTNSPTTAAPIVAPTAPPTTIAPVAAPTEPPTTEAPVAARIVEAPTDSPVTAPTEPPTTEAPIAAPVAVPAPPMTAEPEEASGSPTPPPTAGEATVNGNGVDVELGSTDREVDTSSSSRWWSISVLCISIFTAGLVHLLE